MPLPLSADSCWAETAVIVKWSQYTSRREGVPLALPNSSRAPSQHTHQDAPLQTCGPPALRIKLNWLSLKILLSAVPLSLSAAELVSLGATSLIPDTEETPVCRLLALCFRQDQINVYCITDTCTNSHPEKQVELPLPCRFQPHLVGTHICTTGKFCTMGNPLQGLESGRQLEKHSLCTGPGFGSQFQQSLIY